jgi:hypothetical protein
MNLKVNKPACLIQLCEKHLGGKRIYDVEGGIRKCEEDKAREGGEVGSLRVALTNTLRSEISSRMLLTSRE